MSLVAIVGRPNVGKSTLFNRLVGMRQAIVDETAGVTRDRHYGQCEWCGTTFSVVDTGGYTSNSEDVFEEEIRKQVMIAIEEADVILFLVEVGTGITDFDEEIADILRRSASRFCWLSTRWTMPTNVSTHTSSIRSDLEIHGTFPQPTAAVRETCWTGSSPCCLRTNLRKSFMQECRE